MGRPCVRSVSVSTVNVAVNTSEHQALATLHSVHRHQATLCLCCVVHHQHCRLLPGASLHGHTVTQGLVFRVTNSSLISRVGHVNWASVSRGTPRTFFTYLRLQSFSEIEQENLCIVDSDRVKQVVIIMWEVIPSATLVRVTSVSNHGVQKCCFQRCKRRKTSSSEGKIIFGRWKLFGYKKILIKQDHAWNVAWWKYTERVASDLCLICNVADNFSAMSSYHLSGQVRPQKLRNVKMSTATAETVKCIPLFTS